MTFYYINYGIFNLFLPDIYFRSPWKHQKTFGLLMFSGRSKGNIGNILCFNVIQYFRLARELISLNLSIFLAYVIFFRWGKNSFQNILNFWWRNQIGIRERSIQSNLEKKGPKVPENKVLTYWYKKSLSEKKFILVCNDNQM